MEELEKMADTIQKLIDKVDKFLDKQELNDIQKSIFARKLDEYYWEVLNDDEEEDEDLDLIENDSNIIKKPQVKIRKSK